MTTNASNMKKPAQQNLGCKILVIELKYLNIKSMAPKGATCV